MKQLVNLQNFFLASHIGTFIFGLVGLLIILPHPELLADLGTFGQNSFALSMSAGGAINILLGTVAVAIFAYRTMGLQQWLSFMIPAIVLSLGSELLGTSTGFPFGEYGYLSGLGYKVAGLVPFTIPLSWFYMGFTCYLLARAAIDATIKPGTFTAFLCPILSVFIGAILLTSWDFTLDPAMSQSIYPFWQFGQTGSFFGTPYRNFFGWIATGVIFMTMAALLWKKTPIVLSNRQLGFLLVIYLSNIAFSSVITLFGVGLGIPVGLSVLFGVIPAFILGWMASLASA
ncbi:carotenoid biosynthesis protein [Cronbergia sp. UHCC 0137]|uniref:gamma-carotene 1'-hydroxylase CruF n=1 Tax=Cronbergia sp. UHCC 0137 TaxID=3110239 RepID=UPI002B20B0F7|nr:carotenoid biosynthesis protein [Cronbergia sp. UHCC 0137]MEA5617214.1 carotenoid biosynthesis protein [Cronbergia sp. UHCC 0137]